MAAWGDKYPSCRCELPVPSEAAGTGQGQRAPAGGCPGKGGQHPPGSWALGVQDCTLSARGRARSRPPGGCRPEVTSLRSWARSCSEKERSRLSVTSPHGDSSSCEHASRHLPDLSARQRLLPVLGPRCRAQGPPLHTAQARGRRVPRKPHPGLRLLESPGRAGLGGRWGLWTWPPPWSLGSEGSSQDAEPRWDMLAFHL